MHTTRLLQLFIFLISIFVVAAVDSSTDKDADADPDTFQQLLSVASEEDLHQVLHRFDARYRDGVFHRDRTAMEVVHGEDPATASELVKMALRRRQVSNSTIPAPPVTTSDTSPVNSPTPDPTRSNPPSNPAANPTSNAQTSLIPPSSPTGAVPVSSTSGAVIYSDGNGVLTTARSSTALFRPTTTTVRRTTTLPDGSVQTITSVEVVDAAYTTLPVAAESGTGTKQPTLQSGAASPINGLSEGAIAAMAGLSLLVLAI